MKKFSIFLLIMCLVFASGCSTTPSSNVDEGKQDEYLITLAHSTTEESSNNHGSLKFKEFVEEKSNGRIKVQVYPNAQLGADRELLEGVQTGQITMMCTGNVAHVNFVPEVAVLDSPFAFKDNLQARAVFEEPDFREALTKAYEEKGFRFLGMSDQGFRTLTANKPVYSTEDVKGLTIRTVENKYQMAIWDAIGANPTPLAFSELYTALQQGAVDAQENPIELIYTQKFYEQQKYIISTNHIFQATLWVMNNEFYNNLPEELKTVVDEGIKYATDSANAYNDSNIGKFKKIIEDYGCIFIDLTEEQLSQFKEASASVWDLVENDYPEMSKVFR